MDTHKKKNLLKISEVEKITNIPRSTIHFYLREGLLHPPHKTGRTMSYYDASHLERLKLIQQMKNDLGIPTQYIKEKISAMEAEKGNELAKEIVDSETDEFHKESTRNRRKHEIIDAAVKVFSQKGFYKTKVKDITDALDMSTGTFYIYFKNKEELFLEAIDDVVKTILGGAANAIKNEKDFFMKMLLRAKVFFEQYSKYSEILNQLRAEMTKDSEWFQNRVKGVYHDLTKPIIREFREAMDQGLVRDIDPDLLAYTVTGIIETMSFRMTVDNTYTTEMILKFILNFFTQQIFLIDNSDYEKRVDKFFKDYMI